MRIAPSSTTNAWRAGRVDVERVAAIQPMKPRRLGLVALAIFLLARVSIR